MCRALIIGAGGVGTVVTQKVAANPVFTDVMLASRTKSKCDAVAAAIGGNRVKTAQVDADSVEELLKSHKCAAILAEPVQGEGGVMPLTQDFMESLRALCDKYNVLLMLDEVQTGNGRSGHLYAYQHYGVTPDVLTTAKGLGGGLPIGATLFFEKSHGTLKAGQHGSTFGANPISCAAACHVLDRIDEELLAEVKAKSEYIFTTLTGKPGIKSVSGLGLMIGIETEGDSSAILKACMDRGILPIKAKTKIRLLPALNIPWDDLKVAVEIIAEEAEKALENS